MKNYIKVFDALEWLAVITSHVLKKYEVDPLTCLKCRGWSLQEGLPLSP